MNLIRKYFGLACFLALLFVGGVASAQTDATAITTAVGSAFTGVATLCVSIGTFFLVYRMVKKIR